MRQVSRPVRRRAGRKGRKDLARSLSCNKASCLSLVSNAILYWNTIKINDIVENLRAQGEEIDKETLSHISLLPFRHVVPNGMYFIEEG
jgi:hypothetical protein